MGINRGTKRWPYQILGIHLQSIKDIPDRIGEMKTIFFDLCTLGLTALVRNTLPMYIYSFLVCLSTQHIIVISY